MTIKKRDTAFCNIKILLTFLVVYGHFIENRIGESEILMIIYKLIYTVHMPLFVFISGYFIDSKEQCKRQAKKSFKLYFIFQLLMYIIINKINVPEYIGTLKTVEIYIETPFWHLWYLFSLGCWAVMGFLVLKINRKFRTAIILMSIVVGCMAGLNENIGREISLSRTLVFMPYYFIGLFIPKSIKWYDYRKMGVAALVVGLMIFLLLNPLIKHTFLWQAGPYEGEVPQEIVYRMICYLIAFLLGCFILTNMPYKRFFFSKVGADTMNVYVFHGFIIMLIDMSDIDIWKFILVSPIVSVAVIYYIYKIFKWGGQIYSLPQKEVAYGSIQGNI